MSGSLPEPGQKPGRGLVHLRELVAAREAQGNVARPRVDPALEPLDAALDRSGVTRLAGRDHARGRRVAGGWAAHEAGFGPGFLGQANRPG